MRERLWKNKCWLTIGPWSHKEIQQPPSPIGFRLRATRFGETSRRATGGHSDTSREQTEEAEYKTGPTLFSPFAPVDSSLVETRATDGMIEL